MDSHGTQNCQLAVSLGAAVARAHELLPQNRPKNAASEAPHSTERLPAMSQLGIRDKRAIAVSRVGFLFNEILASGQLKLSNLPQELKAESLQSELVTKDDATAVHTRLFELFGSQNQDLLAAYQIGGSLYRASRDCGSIREVRDSFRKDRLYVIGTWLEQVSIEVPEYCAKAVDVSLHNWARALEPVADDESVERWSRALRRQSDLWLTLLSGDRPLLAISDSEAYVETLRSVSRRHASIASMAIRALWLELIILTAIVAGLVSVTVYLDVSRVVNWATIVAATSGYGVALWQLVRRFSRDAVVKIEQRLWRDHFAEHAGNMITDKLVADRLDLSVDR